MTSFFADKRVVVTGGAGFLGSCVVKKLRERGCASITVPRRATCDLTRWENITRLLDQASPHIVIHLAGVVDNPVGGGNTAAAFYKNLMMGVQLMEAARQRGVEKMVCLGTASSYPKLAPTPLREEELWNGYPDETRAPYGIAKKILLVQSKVYRQQYAFNCIYLIPANLFGPGDNFDPHTSYVIPALIRKFFDAVRNGDREIVCWGSGSSTRDFLFVDDCAEAILLATERYNDGEAINVGTGFEISIRDLAYHIGRQLGFSGQIVWDTSKPDGQPRRRLDGSRAERAFGFRPRTDFFEGLRKTIDWYRAKIAQEEGKSKSCAGSLKG